MNKQLLSLACLTLLAATLPSCRNRKTETTARQEEINTMIELDSLVVEQDESADAKIIKF